jgi:hypothetical protein
MSLIVFISFSSLSSLGIHSGIYLCPLYFYWSFLPFFWFFEFVTVEFFRFWRSHVDFFHIFCVSALGFVYLRLSHWLEVLITLGLLLKVFSVFRQDSIMSELRYYFSPLDMVYGSVATHSPTCSGHQAWSPTLFRLRKSSWSILYKGQLLTSGLLSLETFPFFMFWGLLLAMGNFTSCESTKFSLAQQVPQFVCPWAASIQI